MPVLRGERQNLKIALIGIFGSRLDEGMRKLCAQVEVAARARHEVLTVDTREFGAGRAWRRLREFRPEVLHYLTGPTWRSLTALRAHRASLPGRPVTIATGVRPFLGPVARRLVRVIAPEVYLAQAGRWAEVLARAGCRLRDFPNWTDGARFRPAEAAQRARLRRQFGLAEHKPVVLHVGHVKPNRNLSALLAAQQSGRYQVWVIGSESESRPGPWRQELTAAGVRVDSHYLPRIEEAYQAADIYVFTVRATPPGEFPRRYNEVGVIDLPLSLLEARACGLPVLTTRHDAVQRFLAEDRAVAWFDGTGDDCLARLDALRVPPAAGWGRLDDRFDLRHLADRLDAVYQEARGARR